MFRRGAGLLARGTTNLVLRGPEFLGVAACGLTFTAWNVAARGTFELAVPLFFLTASYVIVLAGKLCQRAVLPLGPTPDFPTSFVVGFFAVSAPLFLLTLATPFGIRADALIVAGVVIVGGLWQNAPKVRPAPDPRPEFLCLLVSLLAATLWSADALQPVVERHGTLIFKPWSDCFVHAAMVRMFRDAHGLGTLQNIMLPGRPAQVYHYAAYSLTALLAAVTETPCYEALTSFLIPVGVLLTGLAAYTLVQSWWGPNAGCAAAIALLLLPDASVYGIKNPYLSYHWLQQVAPTGTYGVALGALAWWLVFEGCRTRNRRAVGLGWLAAGLVVLYKAHIFVALALPIWLAPPLLIPGIAARRRVVWFVSALAVFLAITALARFIPAVPILRLDGSGMSRYVEKLAANLPPSRMRDTLSVPASSTAGEVVAKGLAHLFFGTFGGFGLACLALVAPVLYRRGSAPAAASARYRVAVALFPWVAIANYLIMALGLAPDRNPITQADELMHRPLVWAYFVVAAWVGGAVYEVVLKDGFARLPFVRAVRWAVFPVLLAVPLMLGRDVQSGPGWGKDFTNIPIPVGFYRCALFLRAHSRVGAVVQDSARREDKALGALAERPEFVIEYPDGPKRSALSDRLRAVQELEQIVDITALKTAARTAGISWYLLRPDARVAWNPLFLVRPAFQSGGYRVYSLSDRP